MSKITSQPQNILSYFWEIASIDVGNRDSAVSSLLKSLVSFQQSYDSPIPWTPPSTFSELEPFLHPDVVYSLKRLLKGLASSREAARQGFTVALIELLRFVPQITIKPVLEYVDKVTEVTGSMKGQDEKEMYLGKVFSLIAITRSGMINRDGVPNADIEDMVKRLVEYARSKAYLEEICYNVLCEIIKEKKGDETFGQFLCDNYLPEGVQTPLQLQIVLAVGYYIPCRSSSSLISGVFDVKHLARLAEIMKETSSAHPRVHSVWEYLMARALGLRIDRIDLNTNTHEELLRYSESDRDDTLIPLQSLWREVIDNGLFTSTHERKYLGFKLFNSVAKLLPDTEIPVLFTPHFLRCLTNNLIKPDNYLAKVSRVTLSTVTELCNQHPKISIHIVTQLIGPHGAKNFDRLTKTKTVESILSNQSQEGLQSYIRYLKSIVLDQTVTTAVTVPTDGMDIVESEEVSEYAKRIDSNRQWAIDALYHLVKSSTIPLTSDIVKSIVQFFLTYSYFLVESTDISHGLQAPTPSLSESTYRLVRSRLISTLQELLSYRGQKISAKKDLDNALEWFRMVVDIMDSLISSDNVPLLHPLDSKLLIGVQNALRTISDTLRKGLKNDDQKQKYLAFELLLSTLYFTQLDYESRDEFSEVITEVNRCMDLMFQAKTTTLHKSNKQKENQDDIEYSPEPVEVLLDILISFLSKSSSLLRSVSETVFKVFVDDMTEGCINLIIDILQTREDDSGQSELFITEDDDEEGEIDQAEEDASDDSDDGEVSDDDSDAQDEGEGVDEELRRKLEEALGKTEEDSSDVESADDEEMMKFDESIAAIFKEKKLNKKAKRETEQSMLHFKQRLLDLVSLYLSDMSVPRPFSLNLVEPLVTLMFNAGVSESHMQLRNKLANVLSKKLVKAPVPVLTTPGDVANAERIVEFLFGSVMKKSHRSMKGNGPKLTEIIGTLLVYILKSVKLSTHASVLVEKFNTLYKSALCHFLKEKHSQIDNSFFVPLVNVFPTVAGLLCEDILSYINGKDEVRLFQMNQAVALLKLILEKNNDAAVYEDLISVLQPFMVRLLDAIILECSDPSPLQGNSKDNKKELVKCYAIALRRSKKLLSHEDFVRAWKPSEVSERLHKVVNHPKINKNSAVRNVCLGLGKDLGIAAPQQTQLSKTIPTPKSSPKKRKHQDGGVDNASSTKKNKTTGKKIAVKA